MRITARRGAPPDQGTLVVAADHEGRLSSAAAELDARSDGLLRRALRLAGKLEHGRTLELLLPGGLGLDRLVLLILGGDSGTSRLELERAGGGMVRRLLDAKVEAATVAPLDGLDLALPPAEATVALAAGARLRAHRHDRYQAKAPEAPARLGELTLLTSAPVEGLLAEALTTADAVLAARDLVTEPANVLTPAAFAERCRELTELGVEVEILDAEALERIGMRALLGVAQGSVNPPFVAVMRWRGVASEAPLALVGKGVCFDSGGISIKPAGGMEAMKGDMAGAAAVVGALRALAARAAPADVVGLVGLVENMPSGTAQRPGDVVTTLAGKTVEVINTDAEGRLVLADVLWYAKDRFKPSAIVDLATLTGAVIVALGHEHAGLFSNDDALAQRLTEAGAATGETLWRLPLGKAYAKHVKSDIADLKNVGRAREAGSTAGAVFLEHFVDGVPWAHLDIAGTSWSGRDLPLATKGATGFGVRLLDRLVATHYERREPRA